MIAQRMLQRIWIDDLDDLPWRRRLLVATARVVLSSVRGYANNKGGSRSNGLTFLTLMAIVPVFTVVFALAGAFGIREVMSDWVRETFKATQFQQVMNWILVRVEEIDFGALGGLGLLFLIYVVLSLMGRIEDAFNTTWRAGRNRNLVRRYADYVAVLFLVPLLVLLATGVNAFFQLDQIVSDIQHTWPLFGAFLRSGLSFVPYLFVCLAAVLLYKLTPNAAVRWIPATITGVLIGITWLLTQWLFFRFQIAFLRSRLMIYGSLALLPLFLIYIQLSWAIVLWGAEVCYAVQNVRFLKPSSEKLEWTPARRRALGLALMRVAVREFRGGRTLSLPAFSAETGATHRRVVELADLLMRSDLLHRVRPERYVPTMPPGEIPLRRVLIALDGASGMGPVSALEDADRELLDELRGSLTEVDGTL